MCGLVGIRRYDDDRVAEFDLARMLDRIRHRGPDGVRTWTDEGVGLGHARLATLDVSDRSAQPMTSRCGRWTIAFNGEITNHDVLRRVLETEGATFRTTGDTEVLLESIALRGLEPTLATLDGMFAFALWDRRAGTLTLARDRFGIKPLHYAVRSDAKGRCLEVRFASEAKALLDGPAEVDAGTLGMLLLGGAASWGARTMLRGVRRVEPGEIVTFDAEGTMIARHWFRLGDLADAELHAELCELDEDALVDRVEECLEDAIRTHLRSDVPVGCLVTGGLDSALVAAIAVRMEPSIDLFHAGTAGGGDTPSAERLARHLGCALHVVRTTDASFASNLVDAVWHHDEPLGDHPAAIPFYQVCHRAADRGVRVLLGGDGSDELFLGYPGPRRRQVLDRWNAVLGRVVATAQAFLPRATRAVLPEREERPAAMLRRLHLRGEQESLEGELEEALAGFVDADRRGAALALLQLGPQLAPVLQRADRLSMAWGVKMRLPYLHGSLARLAINLPARARIRRTLQSRDRRHPFLVDKWIVRRIAERWLPESLAARPRSAAERPVAHRLGVDSSFFHGGFLADWFGLGADALDRVLADAGPSWRMQLLSLETWGRLYAQARPAAEVRAALMESIDATSGDDAASPVAAAA